MLKLDSRIKILIVACVSTLSVIMIDVRFLAILFVVNVVIGIILGVDYLVFIKRARYLLIVVVSLTIIQSIFASQGNPIISILGFTILTDYGLDMGLQFILRMSIIISSAMVIATSSIREVTDGLIKMKLPYELAFMMSISIRFLPEFRQDFKNRVTALTLRGIDMSSLSIANRIKVYTYLLTPVVTGSVIRSQMLSLSMQSRAFRAYNKRTMLREMKLSMIDYIIGVIIVAAFVCVIILTN